MVNGLDTMPSDFLLYFCGYNLTEGASFPSFKMTTGAAGEVLVCRVILENRYLDESILKPTFVLPPFPQEIITEQDLTSKIRLG